MNKMTKLGVSALCGSLAAISAANAGEMTVSGGADMSWVSLEKQTTGNPIGIGSNVSFAGSGELDNGWTVDLSITMNNLDAYSNTNVTVTVPSLGALIVGHGVTGTGIDRMDDVTPNVWEEAYATGVAAGIQTVGGGAGGAGIEYTPNMMPDGLTARAHWSPRASQKRIADKGVGGSSGGATDSSYDLTLVATDAILGMEGLTIHAGLAKVEQFTDTSAIDDDLEETTVAIVYKAGGFTLGYQWSEQDLGRATDPQQYDNDAYGITFNVNDDLSIGYNNYESQQVSATSTTAEASSIQVAYTMGGASIRLAETNVDNASYQTTTAYDKDGTTISVSLAF
jgi:hypothetical protein